MGESVYDTLKDQLSLERHGGRTPAGVFTRVAQRLLALAACIWHSWTLTTTVLRSLIAWARLPGVCGCWSWAASGARWQALAAGGDGRARD